MALLAFYGFDEPGVADTGWDGYGIDAPGRVSGRAWSAQATSTSARVLSFPASAALIAGFAIKFSEILTTAAWLTLRGDAGATSHLNVIFDSVGHLVLRRGTTTLATSAQTASAGVWYYLEVKATIADAGGVCVVRVDGVDWINFTGDTRNAGTATTIDSLRLIGAGSGTSGTITWDDMYVCDGTGAAPYNDFIGDHKVETLRPAGNGASSQFVGSDGNSVDNYLLVNEVTPDPADYVGSGVAGSRDLYDTGDLAATTSGTVRAVQVQLYAAKSDAGTATVKTAIRSPSGVVDASTAQPLSTTYAMLNGPIRLTDPDGAAWTIGTVNGMQVGAEVG